MLCVITKWFSACVMISQGMRSSSILQVKKKSEIEHFGKDGLFLCSVLYSVLSFWFFATCVHLRLWYVPQSRVFNPIIIEAIDGLSDSDPFYLGRVFLRWKCILKNTQERVCKGNLTSHTLRDYIYMKWDYRTEFRWHNLGMLWDTRAHIQREKHTWATEKEKRIIVLDEVKPGCICRSEQPHTVQSSGLPIKDLGELASLQHCSLQVH